jgi:hypothetical protein
VRRRLLSLAVFGAGTWGGRRGGCAASRLVRALTACFLVAISWVAPADASPATNAPAVLLVLGAPGEPEFGSNFVQQARLWEKTCERAGARLLRLGLDTSPPPNDYDRLQQALAAEPKDGAESLWLVLVGHGTYDGKEARFNLRGPDVPATDLADWLKPFRRPLVVINASSASAPFLNKLSATNRIIVTATRSGNEQNFARFGQYFAEALGDPQSDLDKDGQTSLLEAFLAASHQVAEFYKAQGRLATEHALLDDNGDGLGTPAEWFRGVRAVKRPEQGASLDGLRAHQTHLLLSPAEQALPPAVRAKRDALELAIAQLREAKSLRSEDDYYRQLEALLVELAVLTERNGSPH